MENPTFHLRHGPKRSIRRIQPVFGRRGKRDLNPPNFAIWPPITSDRHPTSPPGDVWPKTLIYPCAHMCPFELINEGADYLKKLERSFLFGLRFALTLTYSPTKVTPLSVTSWHES